MKKQLIKFSIGFALTGILFSACKKDNDSKEENEEEVITTMVLKLTPIGGAPVEYKYDDADGPGGAAPKKDVITIARNTIYEVELLLLNKTVNPVDTVSNEVEEEAEAHRFYFEPSAGSNITVQVLDTDDNNVPVGLNSLWMTNSTAATGKIKITLRHYAGNPPGKASGDLVNSTKSSTDMEVEFDTKIQ